MTDGKTCDPGAGPAPKPKETKIGIGTTLRTGGCLISLLLLMAILAVVAAVYRPPKPAPQSGQAAVEDEGGDGGSTELSLVRAVAVSPDGTLAAYGGSETRNGRYVVNLRRIRDRAFVDRDEPFLTIEAHDADVWALRFSPDGRRLLSASLDGTVGLWTVDGGERAGTLVPPGDPGDLRGLAALAVSPDGRYVAGGGWTGDVYVWDLSAAGAAPIVFPAVREPWTGDPKTQVPTGHLQEVRALSFVPGDPALLISGGGEGLIAGWNLAERRPGRVATVAMATPNVHEILMRQVAAARDADFAIVSLLPSSVDMLASDYRGCVYLLAVRGPCRDWWLGGGPQPSACVRPLLDNKKFCVPIDRPVREASGAFFGLAEYPGLEGGFVGIAAGERFRVFRRADAVPWREFAGSAGRRDGMSAFAASTAGGFVVTAGRTGRLRLYGLVGEAVSPDITLTDRL